MNGLRTNNGGHDNLLSKDQCSDNSSSSISRYSDNLSLINDSVSLKSSLIDDSVLLSAADRAVSLQQHPLSLAANLNRCLHVLRKMREIYAVPVHIDHTLKTLEQELIWCVERCCGESAEDGTLYPDISRKLKQVGSKYYTKLRLVFSRSPYWEYYHRNVREIADSLEHCLHTGLIFERKFVSMDQVVGARTWGTPVRSSSTPKSNHPISRDNRLASV